MTAVEDEKRAGVKDVGQALRGREAYYEKLRTLSEASVHQHFDAFLDIDWDAPEMQVLPDDERCILPEVDELGAHPWYKSLPKERQIEIGKYRLALIAKVGLQFEQLLIAGVMNRLLWTDGNNPEFRYATHEVTEETHHTQMFQMGADALCPDRDVAGARTAFKVLMPVLASAGAWFPEAFFVGVLAGEEPIDHLQKNIMRAGGTHPMVDRVMQIHIAEEARHISFAHQYLEQHVPELNPVKKQLLALVFPLVMRWLCDVIMVPSKKAREDMGIPDEVAREIWWDAPESRKVLRDMFSDVRMLADNLGVRSNPVHKLLWKLTGIDGRAARFRAEPSTASH